MLQAFCCRFSLKTGALMFGIFFMVNSLFHIFVGLFFFLSKTRFYSDDIPLWLAAGSLAVGIAQLFANLSLIEGVMRRSRPLLVVWQVVHSVLLAAYAAAAAALWATYLDTAQLPALRKLCPPVVATMIVLLSVHGALQVYALIVVESLRRKFLLETSPLSLDFAYKRLEGH